MTNRLICSQCRHRYSLKPGQRRRAICPGCHRRNLKKGARKGWITKRRRKASGARTGAVQPPATTPLPDLETLLREAESKASRALEAALSVARRRGIGT
jgi:PHP family Zn ribbon phosphoesterase